MSSNLSSYYCFCNGWLMSIMCFQPSGASGCYYFTLQYIFLNFRHGNDCNYHLDKEKFSFFQSLDKARETICIAHFQQQSNSRLFTSLGDEIKLKAAINTIKNSIRDTYDTLQQRERKTKYNLKPLSTFVLTFCSSFLLLLTFNLEVLLSC